MLEDFLNSLLYPQNNQLSPVQFLFLIFFLTWNLFWKGWALWKSARKNDKKWYIVLMIFQTLGILDIFYLILTRKKEKKAGVV